ncbi:MAG: penicillin-binding protein 2 [Chloroflexi bacterium]|nr:penicillin-binding protein 2 [Chloroflexota bacterium]MCI0575388.1 penicillin-binding protein 2 [Chloroflexota bacterium]MCI0643849.1 penicillin-binding protein 2 [Chloroflexota bacterium]MCI0726711.1 penicillin-binding protein 2 [Chloroflexota bacterium]
MTESQGRRLWVVVIGLVVGAAAVIFRLASFQVVQDEELAAIGRSIQYQNVIARPERGVIYDRNMAVLAGNSSDYQVGVSPSLVTEPEEMATALAPILQQPRHEILQFLTSEQPFILLAGRVSPEMADALRALPYDGLQIDPLPRRIYPQGSMLCHALGYTDFDGVGGAGLEGYYQSELAGEAASATINISPLTIQESVIAREGADLVLTIDRSVQYMVEEHLQRAINEYGASGGTIIVMDPRTGAILAMASTPCYSPYRFFEANEEVLFNPAVSQQYEPGSVMKLVTMASALDSGTVTPQSTYYDAGVIELGGYPLYNWDRSARGQMDMTGLLAHSLNVGAATIATWMGPDTFYSYLQRFGFGRPTGIDLMAEAGGLLPLPGDSEWTETNLGTNAFGQGLAVTPLQMISAASALANRGYLMQPYLVQEIQGNGRVFHHDPTVLSRPITEQTANQMAVMAVNAVRQEVVEAQVEGYTIAGKTGTAQIPVGGIYHPTDTIASFIGWLPADAPEIIVLIKLDRPTVSPWGSQTAAPAFATLIQELVVLLDIPPDNIRLNGDVMAVRKGLRTED